MISARRAAWQAVCLRGASGEALVAVAGKDRDAAGEFEREEFAEQLVGAESGPFNELVEAAGIVAERRQERRSGRFGRGGVRRERRDIPKLFENVARRLDELGALLDQLVAAAGDRRVDRSRNGEDLAPLLGGETGSDQRTAFGSGLDDQDAARETGDDAVAAREVGGDGGCAERKLGDDGAVFGNRQCQFAVA